jgi:hypothetical protein
VSCNLSDIGRESAADQGGILFQVALNQSPLLIYPLLKTPLFYRISLDLEFFLILADDLV